MRFVYSNGTLQDLGTLPGGSYSFGYGINDSGAVTGYGDIDGNQSIQRAFLYSNGVLTDIGTLPNATFSNGTAINASGAITGASGQYAFIYLNGTMQALGDLGGGYSNGTAINASGEVTGNSSVYWNSYEEEPK